MPAIALIIGALIAIIDQVIKLWVVNYLKPVGTVNVI
jgi:lipoprotein signal peptidase